MQMQREQQRAMGTTTTFKPRIRRLANGRILVESRTRPGLGHQVDVARGTCSCEAGKRGRRCWHRAWAEQAVRFYTLAEMEQVARGAQQQRPAMEMVAPVPQGPFEQSAGYRALAECFA